MELFNRLKENKIWDAQIVGKNMFCKHAEDPNYFSEYFDFCIKVSTYPTEIEARSFFVREAELSLNIFAEKADITEEMLNLIQEKRKMLVDASSAINEKIEQERATIYNNRIKTNAEALTKLATLKDKMLTIDTQKSFENVLGEIAIVDASLDKSILTKEQTATYENLTRGYSELVSKKMADLAHNEDIKYNKAAAESFKKAFILFKSDEDKYKKYDNQLYELVAKYLFSYDAKRLFSETLIYYNHVYAYIFNKLDDDGKFRFTQFSFDTPKNK